MTEYPKLIVLMPGILVVAKSEEHERELRDSELRALVWGGVLGVVVSIATLAFCWWVMA